MAWNNNNKGGNCAKTTYKMDVSVSDGNPLKVDGVIWIKFDIKISLLNIMLWQYFHHRPSLWHLICGLPCPQSVSPDQCPSGPGAQNHMMIKNNDYNYNNNHTIWPWLHIITKWLEERWKGWVAGIHFIWVVKKICTRGKWYLFENGCFWRWREDFKNLCFGRQNHVVHFQWNSKCPMSNGQLTLPF